MLVSYTIFPDKSFTLVEAIYLRIFRNLSTSGRYRRGQPHWSHYIDIWDMFPCLRASNWTNMPQFYKDLFLFNFIYYYFIIFILIYNIYCNIVGFTNTFLLLARKESPSWWVVIMDFQEQWNGNISKDQRILMILGVCWTTCDIFISYGVNSRVVDRLNHLMIYGCIRGFEMGCHSGFVLAWQV